MTITSLSFCPMPIPPCAICNRARKSSRYPTCCSDCPETGGERHSAKCDYFQTHEEHLPKSIWEAASTMPLKNPGKFDIHPPAELTKVRLFSCFQGLTESAKKKDFWWQDSAKKWHKCSFTTDGRIFEAKFPMKMLGTDIWDYGNTSEVADRGSCFRYNGEKIMVSTAEKGCRFVEKRLGELLENYAKDHDAVVFEWTPGLLKAADTLRFPPYYICDDETVVYEKGESNMTDMEEGPVVIKAMHAVAEATEENPVVKLKAIMAIANRFHVGITEERLLALQRDAKAYVYAKLHPNVEEEDVTAEQAATIEEEEGWMMAPPVDSSGSSSSGSASAAAPAPKAQVKWEKKVKPDFE